MPETDIKRMAVSFFLRFQGELKTVWTAHLSSYNIIAKSPFCSVQVHCPLSLCYHDSDLIVGVYSAFCEWVCRIHHFAI